MTRTRTAIAVVTGGLGWSVSFLTLMTALEATLGAATLVALMWPIKIVWSIAHTAVSRWRGHAAAVRLACECCTCG